MRNLEEGDIVTAPGLRFEVTYYNKTDESYNIRLISQSGEFMSDEIVFVKSSKLERVQHRVSVGDVYKIVSGKRPPCDEPSTLVVIAVAGDRVKVYSATVDSTFNTTVDDITNPLFYTLVKGAQ